MAEMTFVKSYRQKGDKIDCLYLLSKGESLRNKKGRKFNIYANGELKVAIYTPDD